MPARPVRRDLAAAALTLALLAGPALSPRAAAAADAARVALCTAIIPALVDEGPPPVIEGSGAAAAENGVTVRWRDGFGPHSTTCLFAGGGGGVPRLDGVITERGPLSAARMFMLQRFWLGNGRHAGPGPDGGTGRADDVHEGGPGHRQLAYLAQQLVNALVPCSVYALLAVAYSLVYGIAGRINLAFGELAMLGSFGAVNAVGLAVAASAGRVALPLAAALGAAGALAAGYGWAVGRVIHRPLARAAGQAFLIATLGLAIALREAVRLSQGPAERWLQPVLAQPARLWQAGGFAVHMTAMQTLVVLLTGGLCWLHLRVLDRTAFGRGWRAVAADAGMAALCGVDTRRVLALTFALAGAYAGVAGWVLAVHYGGVGAYSGVMYGFKALVAAVIGGFGAPAGAMLGGVALGLLETLWSGYIDSGSRDIAVFGLLALTLLLRPDGVLGVAFAAPDAGRRIR